MDLKTNPASAGPRHGGGELKSYRAKELRRGFTLQNFSKKNLGGFTFIEVLVTMGIMVFIAGLGLFIAVDQYKSYALSADRNVVVSMLQRARGRSMNNINESEHGFTIDANFNYVLFQTPSGMGYGGRTVSYDEVVPKSPAISIVGAQHPIIIFEQLSGKTDSNGIQLQTDAGMLSIDINEVGQVDW